MPAAFTAAGAEIVSAVGEPAAAPRSVSSAIATTTKTSVATAIGVDFAANLEHDRFSTPAYARRLASLLPAADVEVITAAAHHPQAEHPDVYAGVVTAFLDRPT